MVLNKPRSDLNYLYSADVALSFTPEWRDLIYWCEYNFGDRFYYSYHYKWNETEQQYITMNKFRFAIESEFEWFVLCHGDNIL